MATMNQYFEESSQVINNFINSEQRDILEYLTGKCISCIQSGGKLMICGNGGSAADSQHFAAEVVGTFYNKSRKGLAALALTTDSSILTAVGNDLGYEEVFARQVEGLAKKGDILIVISTSGNSKNCIKAVEKAKELGIYCVGFLGGNGGKLIEMCDLSLVAPSADTPKIQQLHLVCYHWICMEIDKMFS